MKRTTFALIIISAFLFSTIETGFIDSAKANFVLPAAEVRIFSPSGTYGNDYPIYLNASA
jgi:hypothetical protein